MTRIPGPGDSFAVDAAEKVRAQIGTVPTAAVILGSGLGEAARSLETEAEFAYRDLPGFPEPTVPGHAGRLVIGALTGTPVAVFMGRVHLYEGHPMSLVTLPARLAAALGAGILVSTAAVGGLDPSLRPGQLVVGTDHLNFLGENPLRGWRDADGRPAFVNPADAYDLGLARAAMDAASAAGLSVTTGVYAAGAGPTYETPVEIEYLRQTGATVVGMSVVPEVCAAAALGTRFLGLYCVTNLAGPGTSHQEVERVAGAFAPRLAAVLERVLPGEE
ncbi:MAG: purine-nucleoside phosphorylase [Actinomycetota bacterium]